MNIVFVLAILGLLLALTFLFSFLKALRSGQFSDCHTPAQRILFDDEPVAKQSKNKTNGDLNGSKGNSAVRQ